MTSTCSENPTQICDNTKEPHDEINFLPPEVEPFFSENLAFVIAIDFGGNRSFFTKRSGLTVEIFPRDADMRLPAAVVNSVGSIGVVHFERNPKCVATTVDNMQVHIHK